MPEESRMTAEDFLRCALARPPPRVQRTALGVRLAGHARPLTNSHHREVSMKKLKLTLEDLRIESFATTGGDGKGGTVVGADPSDNPNNTCVGTCWEMSCAPPLCYSDNCPTTDPCGTLQVGGTCMSCPDMPSCDGETCTIYTQIGGPTFCFPATCADHTCRVDSDCGCETG